MIRQLLSYNTIIEDIQKFKKTTGDYLDLPGTFFFKIIFYFNNPGENDGYTSNLLGLAMDGAVDGGTMPMDDPGSEVSIGESPSYTLSGVRGGSGSDSVGSQFGSQPAYTSANTAYNYLCMNGEWERAKDLQEFIYMLSDISANSPWYFKSVEGVDAILDRTWVKEGPKVEEQPGAINIKCIQDSIDMRITTMLDLYRSACWSQAWRREIVPGNLRKFDMGIYIFPAPVKGSTYNTLEKSIAGSGSGAMSASDYAGCHYLELHDCEIDPGSAKSGFGGVDNERGFAVEQTITITYSDYYVSSYNDQLCRVIGDLVKADMDSRLSLGDFRYEDIIGEKDDDMLLRETARKDSVSADESADRLAAHMVYTTSGGSKSLLSKAIDNLQGVAENTAKKLIRKAYLGNVNGFSIANIRSIGQQAASGDVIGAAARAVRSVVPDTVESIKNKTIISDTIPSLVPKRESPNVNLGNVFKNIVRNL